MRLAFPASLALVAGACGGASTPEYDVTEFAIAYADLATQAYADSLDAAESLQYALETLVADPTAEHLEAARAAWIDAREPYRPTEALRFYGGPIDAPDDAREAQINAWPIDEASIDYVVDDAGAGVINDPDGFGAITVEAILAADLQTGYHAIELLLWGQDLSDTGPGERPHTDYLTTGGTAANQDRRGAYLLAVADLLVDDLAHVHAQWAGPYRDELVDLATTKEVMRRIMTGIGTLAASELSAARMLAAYESQDPEDEHSAFSDTTKADLYGNALGIEQVWETFAGLIQERDPDLAEDTHVKIHLMLDAIEDIPGPFDQAIQGDDTDPGRVAVLAAVRATEDVGDAIVACADTLAIEIDTDR